MSLINDALKRAKEAHESLPPPPPTAAVPQFRPVEPAENRPGIGPGVMLLGALCLLLLLGLMISWVWVQHNSSRKSLVVQASSPAKSAEPTASTPAPVAGPPSSPPPATVPAPSAPAVVSAPAEPAPAPAPVTPPPDHEIAPIAEPPPPPPPKPALKLQGIVYNPVRPAAMISGKTLFIGDRTGEWRVIAIDQESATLVSATQTNVLTLAQ